MIFRNPVRAESQHSCPIHMYVIVVLQEQKAPVRHCPPVTVCVCVCVCVYVCVCLCALFTMVWRITRWTHDRQPLPSQKEHRNGSMGKAKTIHTAHTLITLLKADSYCSLSEKNPDLSIVLSHPRLAEWQTRMLTIWVDGNSGKDATFTSWLEFA